MSRRAVFWLSVCGGLLLFLFLTRSVMLPFVVGSLTAYFLDPAADWLETRPGVNRTLATIVITGGFFLTVIVLIVLLAPLIGNQLTGLLVAMPDYIADIERRYGDDLHEMLGGLSAEQADAVKQAVSNASGMLARWVGEIASGVFQSGLAVLNVLMLLLITPVVAFYLLRDWDGILARADALLPRAHVATIRTQFRAIDDTIAGFIRGQVNVCLLLAAYYALSLSLIGLKFGAVIGLLAGLLVIVPYVGFGMCAALGMGIAFFQFGIGAPFWTALGVFAVGQALESYALTPKLVGEKVGLHPVWIIFGMMAGGALLGFVGVLLAVPLTAVIGVLIRFGLQHYLASSYYHGTLPSPECSSKSN